MKKFNKAEQNVKQIRSYAAHTEKQPSVIVNRVIYATKECISE